MDASAQLRQRAEQYEKAAKRLREMAQEVDELEGKSGSLAGVYPNRSGVTHSDLAGEYLRINNRFKQLTSFLRAHGPMLRRDILAEFQKLGVPINTIGAMLTTKHFAQDEEKRWYVKDEKTQE